MTQPARPATVASGRGVYLRVLLIIASGKNRKPSKSVRFDGSASMRVVNVRKLRDSAPDSSSMGAYRSRGLFIVSRRTGDCGFRRFGPRPKRHVSWMRKLRDSLTCPRIRSAVLYRRGSRRAGCTTGRPRSAGCALKIDAMCCLDDCTLSVWRLVRWIWTLTVKSMVRGFSGHPSPGLVSAWCVIRRGTRLWNHRFAPMPSGRESVAAVFLAALAPPRNWIYVHSSLTG
jgi:hypothetical protein